MSEARETAAAGAVAKKRRYHHGALREALIEAAHGLISEKGLEAFTVSDACRAAGVSTAAPYRHFADRDALVDAVTARGFELLTERTRTARDRHPAGSIESIIAMGHAYVHFVGSDPELFQLMWGAGRPHGPALEAVEAASEISGDRCFNVLLNAVEAFRAERGLETMTTLSIAVPLWTLVHGTASLVLGRRFDKVAPGLDVDAMVARTTRAFLSGLIGEAGAREPPATADNAAASPSPSSDYDAASAAPSLRNPLPPEGGEG